MILAVAAALANLKPPISFDERDQLFYFHGHRRSIAQYG